MRVPLRARRPAVSCDREENSCPSPCCFSLSNKSRVTREQNDTDRASSPASGEQLGDEIREPGMLREAGTSTAGLRVLENVCKEVFLTRFASPAWLSATVLDLIPQTSLSSGSHASVCDSWGLQSSPSPGLQERCRSPQRLLSVRTQHVFSSPSAAGPLRGCALQPRPHPNRAVLVGRALHWFLGGPSISRNLQPEWPTRPKRGDRPVNLTDQVGGTVLPRCPRPPWLENSVEA